MLSVDQLPSDPQVLLAIIRRQREELAQRDATIARQVGAIAQIGQEAACRIEALQQKHEAEMLAILRRFYGPRSERFDPTQLLLFGIAIDRVPVDQQAVEEESGQKLTTRRPRRRHKHGRQTLPECLRRQPVEHKLEGEKLRQLWMAGWQRPIQAASAG